MRMVNGPRAQVLSVRVILALVLGLAGAGRLWAGEGAAATATPQDPATITSLDEIVVSGRLDTISQVRKAMKEAEQRFYDRYNELNRDSNYDIVCRNEAPTGSRLKRDNCQAKGVDEIGAQQAREFVRGTYGTTSLTPITILRADAASEMRRRALVMIKADPELLRNLLEHAKLEQMYQEMLSKKYKGWPGVR